MFRRLKEILARIDADYSDIRFERMDHTMISLSGHDLTSVARNMSEGFVIRVLKGGGLASIAVTAQVDLDGAIRTVIENAKILGRSAVKPHRLAPTPVVCDTALPTLDEDPRNVSTEEKTEILRRYNAIPLARPSIVSTMMAYREVIREKYFLSTEGSQIREDLVTAGAGGSIIARDGTLTQDIRCAIGGGAGFGLIRGREKHFEERTRLVEDLLRAKPVEGGKYNVVLGPMLAGVFTHEAFGHSSEADLIEHNRSIRERMKIGSHLGSSILNITDDATTHGHLGHYRYDDEGVAVRKTPLMREGVLVGRLHSRRTAESYGEPLSGHCIAEDSRFAPIIRMGNIFIEPGQCTFDALLHTLGNGLYLADPKGGQTEGEEFSFGAQYGYVVRNGSLAEMVRDINISGNMYVTMDHVTAIGDRVEMMEAGGTGGCGKGLQSNIRSGIGAPPILVSELVVGGV
ncbi:MAG: TldD/PmbA family protein [Candidatus Ozemobacteraceae bacterium]